MVQKYQNEIPPIFYYGISTKTNKKDLRTSWPYFRVKLSCVCLKFTYKKKSKDKNTIVIYDKMIYYCKLQNVNIQST